MSRANTLKSLEIVLESFLDRAVGLKESRLHVLDGINHLDDIALQIRTGQDLTDEIGGWFAGHTDWLNEDSLRTSDRNRIGEILDAIKTEFRRTTPESPASDKIAREIDRWDETVKSGLPKLVLKRGPEKAAPETDKTDSIALFNNTLGEITGLFADLSTNKVHILSVLDDALKSALMQQSREALLLSAFIIYYLRQNGYMVEPYVKRLKEAEAGQKGAKQHA